MSMKVTLVVASGVHQGKQIPISGTQFLIGRDPTCQLRPASQLVSKQHCAIIIQNGKVYLKDYGSTNGTFLNETQVEANSTIALTLGDRVRVGPLDFSVEYTSERTSDSTPMPDQLKAISGPAIEKLKNAAGLSGSTVSAKPEVTTAKRSDPLMKPTKDAPSQEDIAAMLLGEDDGDGPAQVPEGSTIMEMPAVVAGEAAGDKDKKKNAIPTREDSSNAANEILKKMMRRQR
jgi:predicted component of type VI protein secretion system